MHHNVLVIDVKTFWHQFLLFFNGKGSVHINCSYFKTTHTCLQNPYYCEQLLLEYMQTRVY